MLRQALKYFDDSLRASKGKNMFAVLGRARAQFSLGKFGDALTSYQKVLEQAPQMSDPDPRIGIGCCLWALGHKDDALNAWQRALEINPRSKIATLLVGLHHLNTAYQYPFSDAKFKSEYKTAMTIYAQEAFKIDNNMPLACSTFGAYFMNMKSWMHTDKLAKRAIELTDNNAIASDGWYLLGRKEHDGEEYARANDYYARADQARGGDEKGWLPAKFGVAQIKVLQNDLAGAKFRLEKIVQQSKNIEAMSLLGALYAEEAFSPPAGTTSEEVRMSARKAIATLEAVRMAWKDPKKNLVPDSAILLKLARLYEAENLERSFQCLQQVEDMELEDLPDEVRPEESEDEANAKATLREHLPPQLLNNLACFHYQSDRLTQARDLFQVALKACVRLNTQDITMDTDALVTTISFNLARTYEAEGMLDEAKQVLQGLLERHPDYVDARLRLTYIALRQSPTDEGPKAMSQLYEAESSNLEVRALYGWYMRKAKKKTNNVAEDQEQRHYKHTLQNHDKHDCYSLTGMGNLYLATAREMPRNTEPEKEKRKNMYSRAIEFFDKAIQLDAQNAYAAQGIAIAVVEDKKDFATALQLFTKIKETIKDASVHINLGHIYCELKQYSRAIENVS
jgi:RNA polymerase-associated protein CTR9